MTRSSYLQTISFVGAKGTIPEFTEHLKNVEVFEGADTLLKCKVTGQPQPEIEWFIDGDKVEETERLKTEFDGETCTLYVSCAELDDEGEYQCLAHNKLGSAKTQAELLVNQSESKPEFTKKIQDLAVCEGEQARFDVRVSGFPKAEVDWFKGKESIEDEGRFGLLDDEEEELFSLVIEDVKPEDADEYECVAFNSAGEVSCAGTLNVTENAVPPEFLGEAQTVPLIVEEGDDIRVSEKVRGKPEPTVIWLKDDKPLKESDRIGIEPKSGVMTLLIKNASPDDTGRYRCEVKSKAGSVSRSYDIQVKGKRLCFIVVAVAVVVVAVATAAAAAVVVVATAAAAAVVVIVVAAVFILTIEYANLLQVLAA